MIKPSGLYTIGSTHYLVTKVFESELYKNWQVTCHFVDSQGWDQYYTWPLDQFKKLTSA